ncbi:Dehydrin [Musa troglodytarum]|uniref:Dehydrin n=1 Tax=Musa troglodytarum TaxID=320322 RepID=A0A9E7FT97_9LILI|nr:Dehydrin [Musa troglodytarum]
MEYSRDEHGNPLSVNQGYGIGAGAATKEQHRCSGTGGLHRSGSSSSSEDDGQGGRRKKKGLKEKVTEKLPGGHKSEKERKEPETGTGAGEQHEKKGLMEKIQEKLPGHHRE